MEDIRKIDEVVRGGGREERCMKGQQAILQWQRAQQSTARET